MEIAPMIITRILRDKNVTLSQLEAKAVERSISLQDLYTALDKVHKDKRIKRGVRQGDVYYEPAPAPKTPTDHLAWVRHNYPRMTEETDGSGIDIDYSFLFLKTKEERDLFISQMSGRPIQYNRKRYEHHT